MPTFDDIRASLHQVKRKHFPRQPLSCAELILPNEFITIETKNFLLLNEGTENKIVIFGTKNFFSLRCESKIVLMDGTFDVVPKIFLGLPDVRIWAGLSRFGPDCPDLTYLSGFDIFVRL